MTNTLRYPTAGHIAVTGPRRSRAAASFDAGAWLDVAGWLDRLAAWADARPQHHRLGRWTLYTVRAAG